MRLSSDILYDQLSGCVTVEYLGKHCDDLSLTMPVFYCENMSFQDGGVYIGRAGELPSPPANVRCLLVCVGGRIPSFWDTGMSCVFSILSETDILSVFNIISETFSRYEKWESDMRRILDGPADLAQMALQARIQRIHQIIDLGTAEKRMYIRYCLFLCEQEER